MPYMQCLQKQKEQGKPALSEGWEVPSFFQRLPSSLKPFILIFFSFSFFFNQSSTFLKFIQSTYLMLAPSRSPQRPVCPPCVQYSPRPQPTRRVQKVPYERKVIQYETYEYQEQVPKQVKKIQYEEKTVIDYVPVQRKVTDYYAVETAKTYVTQTHQNRRVQMVPVERTVTKVNYKPVTRVVQNKPPQLGGVQSPSRQNYSPYPSNNFNSIQPSVPQFWPTAQSVVSGRPTFSEQFVQKCYQAGFSEDTPMSFDQFMEVLARLKNKSFDKPIIDKVWGEAPSHTPAEFARVIKGTSLEEQL